MSSKNAEIQASIDSFDIDRARTLLRDALKEADAETYYLAAQVALNDDQKRDFLKKAIELDPFHGGAHKALNSKGAEVSAPPALLPQAPLQSQPEPAVAVATLPRFIAPPAASTKWPRSRLLSGPLGAILLLAFFLPWAMVSCDSERQGNLSAFDLVRYDFALQRSDSIPPFFYKEYYFPLLIIPVAAVVTLLTCFFHNRILKSVSTVYLLAGSSALLTLLLKYFDFEAQLKIAISNSTAPPVIAYQYGSYLTLGALAGIIVAGVLAGLEARGRPHDLTGT